MVLAVQRVRERLLRATRALAAAGVPYALAGDNAVAAWVETADPGAVRSTPGVEILLRRADFPAAAGALCSAGFVHRSIAGTDVFLDAPDGRARDAVRIIFAGEKIRPEDSDTTPEVGESEQLESVRVISQSALVRMQLASFRLNDRVNLRDMIDVGLVDASWVSRFPVELAARLQQLIDTPAG